MHLHYTQSSWPEPAQGIVNDAVSIVDTMLGKMQERITMERTGQEADVTYFMALSQNTATQMVWIAPMARTSSPKLLGLDDTEGRQIQNYDIIKMIRNVPQKSSLQN